MHDLGGVNPQSNTDKIDAFLNYLVEDSPAEKWFKAHQAGATAATTWQALEAAFHVHFPGPVKAECSAQEWEQELVGIKLMLEELNRQGRGHRCLCTRPLRSGIWQSRDALPELLCEKVSSTQNWAAYITEIKAINRAHIREGVTIDATPAHDETFGAGGGQGNLFKPPEMTNKGREHLRKIVEGLSRSMLQDDTMGCTEYTRQIAGWVQVHGSARVLLERTGYPISPGTAPPCSGECYSCGKVTTPFHRSANCLRPEVPIKERIFQGLCTKFLKEMLITINAVLDELDWMDFLQDEGPADFGAGLSDIQDDMNVLHDEQCDVTNLYTVGTGEEKHCKPFEWWIIIEGPQGEKVQVKALWDGGALTGAMDMAMVNGTLVKSLGHWEGYFMVKDVWQHGAFEIFDSGGRWEFLFRKLLQAAFGVIHDYALDVVDICVGGKCAKLQNQHGAPWWEKQKLAKTAGVPRAFEGVLLFTKPPLRHRALGAVDVMAMVVEEVTEELAHTTRVEEVEEVYVQRGELHMHVNSLGACVTPVREVPNVASAAVTNNTDKLVSEESVHVVTEEEADDNKWDGMPSKHVNSVGVADHDTSAMFDSNIYDIESYIPTAPESVYMRTTDPFKLKHVVEIQRLVQVGLDLTVAQREEVYALVEQYADIFALAVSEVSAMEGAVYTPKIPKDIKFSTKSTNTH
ncbi:hypothetical protein C8J57DRAFT_1528925 [Mycena rebaudengoi]|nr:hypothetical protein C8J57DRAFT_1528925 [Mycena rebaudengoi]